MLLHGAAANMLNVPELMLSQQETALLAGAMVDCADAWGFNPVSDPRVVSSVTLAGLIVVIYGPKVKIAGQKMQDKKRGHIANEG